MRPDSLTFGNQIHKQGTDRTPQTGGLETSATAFKTFTIHHDTEKTPAPTEPEAEAKPWSKSRHPVLCRFPFSAFCTRDIFNSSSLIPAASLTSRILLKSRVCGTRSRISTSTVLVFSCSPAMDWSADCVSRLLTLFPWFGYYGGKYWQPASRMSAPHWRQLLREAWAGW